MGRQGKPITAAVASASKGIEGKSDIPGATAMATNVVAPCPARERQAGAVWVHPLLRGRGFARRLDELGAAWPSVSAASASASVPASASASALALASAFIEPPGPSG